MRLVRPPGLPDSLGLILPTIPWTKDPASQGRTVGANRVPTLGATETLRQIAAAAERAGASALWACDHLFWHQPLLEPLISLAVAATATDSASIGTCVLQLPLRDPATVARQVATLQELSGGRMILGLGVGTHAGEYEAAGARFEHRGRMLDEGLATMRRAWSTAGRPDLRYRLEPEPAAIPIWLAGSSEAAIGRAARVGDGWIPMFIGPGDYAAGRERLLALAARVGRDPLAVHSAVVVMVCVGDSVEVARKDGTTWLADLYDLPPKAFERHLVAGPPEECAEAIAAYRAAGAGHVAVMIAANETLEHFGALAEACSATQTPDRSHQPPGAAP